MYQTKMIKITNFKFYLSKIIYKYKTQYVKNKLFYPNFLILKLVYNINLLYNII